MSDIFEWSGSREKPIKITPGFVINWITWNINDGHKFKEEDLFKRAFEVYKKISDYTMKCYECGKEILKPEVQSEIISQIKNTLDDLLKRDFIKKEGNSLIKNYSVNEDGMIIRKVISKSKI